MIWYWSNFLFPCENLIRARVRAVTKWSKVHGNKLRIRQINKGVSTFSVNHLEYASKDVFSLIIRLILSSFLIFNFIFCPFYRNADVSFLESWLHTALTYTAMTDYPTPSNFLNPLPAYPVKQVWLFLDYTVLHFKSVFI